ncbi:alpha-amylase [Paenibacillus spiritus]|uniref:Alpha-amylase n=1 Tax=Paenibacillus spiritus TaxID=2496557 RepID=A0A5J5GGU4_9BACL|nr:alpha-amylase family glycosyl hydrolase [Paenibacillus spiritus]KAA9007426.1 alpha-amylase [Paenibacillus spiritus]
MSTLFNKERRRWLSLATAVIMVLQLVAGLFPASVAKADEAAPVADTLIDQPGGRAEGWIVVGIKNWENADQSMRMKHLVDGFYELSTVLNKGHYEFKIVKGGTWEGFSSSKGKDGNFSFDLDQTTKVNFYINEKSNQARISLPGVDEMPQYEAKLESGKWPRLVGTVQQLFGEENWSPSKAGQYFVDYNFDGSVYKLQRTLPAGEFEAKVAFGPDWTESYGGSSGNLNVNLEDKSYVTFSIDYAASSRVLSYTSAIAPAAPSDSEFDGIINKNAIAFDSRSLTFKKPFGAIKMGQEDVTLRVAAKQGDVELAKVELSSPEGISNAYTMHLATSVDGKDYFEATVPKKDFNKIGVWGYKFILLDGTTKVEYGDDSSRGGSGAVSESGALSFDLTVYDPDFKTPDWMKTSVVYQIFPDRFYDGDPTNNRAKTADGSRGTIYDYYTTSKGGYKLQYYDGGVDNDPTPDQVWGEWSDVPENPNRITEENKPYFPDAKSDGVYSNDFYGGDIKGIQEKLDYLKDLGVTTLYLNPVSWASSNHKYDATDYEHLDPMFGKPVYNTPDHPESGLDYTASRAESDRVYQAFAKAAREKGLRLINDGVFNHVGDDSIYFDRYAKYPEIGAYEYWAKVYDMMDAKKISEADAELAVRKSFTSQINPLTGKNYAYPEDFEYTTWFTIEKSKVTDNGMEHYKYDAWWGYDSLPVMDAKEPQTEDTPFYKADTQALDGKHEWNNVAYRDEVIGHDLTGLSETEASAQMQSTNSQRWLWMGSSGWRLDVAPDVSNGTWEKFREAVKSVEGRKDVNGKTIEDPIILGEEWGVATKYLLGDQFDSVMNYRFRSAVQSFMISGNAANLNQALESIREDYPEEAWKVMLNLVDSHDTTRSITKYDHPDWEEENLKVADPATDNAIKLQALTAIMQMGYPGAPTIYYGDEVGVTGTKDPDSRRTFPWERVKDNGDGSFSATGRYSELFSTYQKAADVRHDNSVFSTGDLHVAYAEGDVIAYARKNENAGGLVAVNRGSAETKIDADVAGFLPEGMKLIDQLGGQISGTVTNGVISLTLPAMTGVMMLSDGSLVTVPQVTGLTAQAGKGSVTLNWSPAADASEYKVYRTPLEGMATTEVATVTTATYTDKSVVNGMKYYYTLVAVKDGGVSLPSEYVSATPFLPVQSVSIVQEAKEMTVGVGKATYEILVDVRVPELTDVTDLVYKEPADLQVKLKYYPVGSEELVKEIKLKYKTDSDDKLGKIYSATFEPTLAGVYEYTASASTNNGETQKFSATKQVVVNADTTDTQAPAAAELSDILQESNMVNLAWTIPDTSDVKGFEVMRKEGDGKYKPIATLIKTARTYIDYTVSNDTKYTYKIVSFDAAYNRSESGEKSVTPKIVMVDVTLRLHLPNYTPSTDGIYIAGDFNGWNASGNELKVPSGATDRSIVEYSFKMMAGKSIQYKYTRGVWDKEAFTSHIRSSNDTTDAGNWAYSSTNTNMQLTIKNEGGNKMMVNDYVLRWVDMPMIITLPRTSYGEDIAYTTDDSKMNLKANVPFGVGFTINGQPIPASAMDAYGNVQLNDIPLAYGVNTFKLHIEPTAETLNLPWYEDKARAAKATKTITLTVTRTGGDTTPASPAPATPTPASPGSATATPQPTAATTTVTVTADQLKPAAGGTATIALSGSAQQVLIPLEALASATGLNRIAISGEQVSLNIPISVLNALKAQLGAAQTAGAQISLNVSKLDTAAQTAAAQKLNQSASEVYELAGDVYDFGLKAVAKDGKAVTLSSFPEPIELSFKLKASADSDLTGVYYLNDAGKAEYVGGSVENGVLKGKVTHFSRYAALEFNKNYSDMPAAHWAHKAVSVLSAKHIVEGSGTGFAPARNVTRAEFAAMLTRTLGLTAKNKASFSDVASTAWYADSVAAAYESGLVKGSGTGTFHPSQMITREEMAAMIVRAYALKTGKNAPASGNPAYGDLASVSAWAKSDVAAASSLGLLQGQSGNVFAPKAHATRAESAQVLYNLLGKK